MEIGAQTTEDRFVELEYSHYLPLAKGNTWTYRKTEKEKIFFWSLSERDKVWYGTIKSETGMSEETYAVKESIIENGLKFWEIQVSSPKARDGRYGAVCGLIDRILWGRVPSSEHIIEIEEIIVRKSYFSDEWKEERPILIEPVVKDMKISVTPGRWDDTTGFHPHPLDMTISAAIEKLNITVSANTWKECLKVSTEVKTEKYQWTRHSYYVRGIGLVKEIQEDRNGDLTYLLELISYTLK